MALLDASREFLVRPADRVSVLSQALRRPGKDRMTALSILGSLPLADRRALRPDLVFLSSWTHGSIQFARDAILALPRAWVVEQIEAIAEPLLTGGDDDAYRRLLELYALLDRDLMLRRARRAAADADADIREAGEDHLE